MNYYAKGGQAHGIQTLAQELSRYGRNGDTILAHINPEEAAMLKAMGGSGTINPNTGLPEFFLNKVTNAISKVLGTSGGGGGILGGLASFDKAVGNAIPGGWGTIASIAASAAGVPLPAQVGLGALTGSGVLRPGRGFNLQGAIMGGITAYGMGKLGEGLRGAAGADSLAGSTSGAATAAPSPGDFAGSLSDPTAGMAAAYKPPSIGSEIMSGNFSNAASRIGTGISDAASAAVDSNTYKGAVDAAGSNISQTGTGIKNLMGLGDGITSKEAIKGFSDAGASMTNTALPIGMGVTGQIAIDEARKQQQQADAANAAAMQDYNTQMGIIAANQARSEEAMRKNPYQFNQGGMPPRFLSGGGDGMSDSIPAKINNRQEARLADGEFVVPADVVSHLGNGSSKAGAKQLYSMMDRVRQKRTGNKEQGKEINARRLMPA